MYVIYDLKDNCNIISGDDSGEILVYDFNKVKIYKLEWNLIRF